MQLLRSNFQAGTQGISVLTTPFNTVSINEVGQHLLKVNAGGCCYTADGERTVSAVEVFIGTTKLGDATRVTGAAVNSGDIGGVFAFQDTFYFAYDAPNTDNGLRVQVTYSGAINCPMFGWELYNDCAMADPFEAPALATGATANPTVTCASFGAGDAVTGGVTIVNGGSCVAQDTATYTGPAWVGMTGRVSGANATDATLTWTRTGTYPWVASAMVLKPASASATPTITSVTNSGGQVIGSSQTATVTNAGATQGTSTLTLDGQAQVITSWSDTSITYTVTAGANTAHAIGTATTLVLTTSAGSASTAVTLAQEDGYTAAILTSVGTTGVPATTPALAIGYQLRANNGVTPEVDGSLSWPSGTSSCQVGVWASGQGYGAAQTVYLGSGAPVATGDSITTAFNTAHTFDPRTNDSSPDSYTLSVSAVTQGTHGSVTFTATSITYTPTTGYSGSDSFTYTISDAHAGSATATVNVTVQAAANNLPSGANAAFTINEDASKTFAAADFGFTDSDVGDTLQAVRIDTLPSAGSLRLSGVSVTAGQVVPAASIGNLVFAPAANANGSPYTTFTFSVQDSQGGYDATPNTITINVTPINDAPVAVADAITVAFNTAYTFDPRTNDTDIDSGSLSVSAVTQGTHGSVAYTASSVTYTPTTGYSGADSFTYTVTDGALTATATVSVTVQAAGITLPAAVGDSFTTNEDTAYSGNLATNDTAGSQTPNTWTKLTDPAHGAVTVNTNGTFTYTPTANYNGSDSFMYRLSDNAGNHSDATVSVTVTAVNDAPVAVDDARSTAVNTPITFDPRTNDTDLEGNTLTVTAVTQGAHGTVSFTGTSVTYTPTTDYTGSDTFTYTISDGTTTDVGSVVMTVTAASSGRWQMTESGLVPLTIWRMTEYGLVAVA